MLPPLLDFLTASMISKTWPSSRKTLLNGGRWKATVRPGSETCCLVLQVEALEYISLSM
jgi:hypothetical protein